jgi:hypothetical protein
MVIASELGSASYHGRSPRWSERRSLRDSRPSLSSASTVVPTKLLPMLAASMGVTGVMARPASTSARPVAAVTTLPSGKAIAAVAPGKAVSCVEVLEHRSQPGLLRGHGHREAGKGERAGEEEATMHRATPPVAARRSAWPG